MLRLAIVMASLLLMAGCGSEEGGEGSPGGALATATDLRVTVWPEGPNGPVRERRVECPGAAVCRELSPQSLAPVPRDTACTAIYGGPSLARVRGTLRGEPVDERFSLEDGCEIARWERNRALLGRAGRGP
jgi:hypothetical protein